MFFPLLALLRDRGKGGGEGGVLLCVSLPSCESFLMLFLVWPSTDLLLVSLPFLFFVSVV